MHNIEANVYKNAKATPLGYMEAKAMAWVIEAKAFV